jgi:hypothetical protein
VSPKNFVENLEAKNIIEDDVQQVELVENEKECEIIETEIDQKVEESVIVFPSDLRMENVTLEVKIEANCETEN